MQTFTETEKRKLIKKFHVLLGKAGGGTRRKEAILWRLGVEHTNELTAGQLIEECDALFREINPELQEVDLWRKRVMAAIGGWCAATGRKESAAYIKAVACRAAEAKDFNGISLAGLRRLYNEFLCKQKVREAANVIDAERALGAIGLN